MRGSIATPGTGRDAAPAPRRLQKGQSVNLDNVCAFAIPEIEHSYIWKDLALYALSLGFGSDPTDLTELPFVYEEGMVAVPSMASFLGRAPPVPMTLSDSTHGPISAS